MDNIRFFLFCALVLVVFLLWQAWMEDYAGNGESTPEPEVVEQPADAPARDDLPAAPEQRDMDDRPILEPDSAEVDQPPARAHEDGGLTRGDRVVVETDLLRVEIDTRGGDLRTLYMLDYPVEIDRPDEPLQLLTDDPDRLYVIQGGLVARDLPAPSHHDNWRVEQREYRLADGADTVSVPLVWEHESGLRVVKRYTFHRGDYMIELEHRLENNSGQDWRGTQYTQLQRREVDIPRDNWFIRTFLGAALYDGSYERLNYDDLRDEPVHREVQGGWVAMIQHYYTGAVIPPADTTNLLYSRLLDGNRHIFGARGEPVSVAPGDSASLSSQLYVGPQYQARMAELAPRLDRTVDYGMLTILAKPVYEIMRWIHSVVGNWGWTIVIFTLMVKAVFYKLSDTQFRSMAKMREFAPRIKALRERHGDDREKLNKAMMELYREEKFNPLGGCLPILVQLPVFIALYWVLIESVEFRHAPFTLWIQDLAAPDPYYVLPVLFGISMFIQQKMSQAAMAMDPIQQRILMFLPLVLMIFFAFFPAGLVLYWFINNIISMAQQHYVNRRHDAEQAARRGS